MKKKNTIDKIADKMMDNHDKIMNFAYVSLGIMLIFTLICAILTVFGLPFVRWEKSENIVSGIVYDATFDGFISGKTEFKVRASAEMATNEDTSRTYCLPGGSEYEPLIREAAKDKSKRVVISTEKYFGFVLPWDCAPIVKVEEE